MKLPASGAHQPWNNLAVDEICSLLATTPAGLTQTEAAKRLAQYGRNELQAAQKVSLWTVYLPVLQEPFGTFNLTLAERVVIMLAAVTVVPVLELAKWLERRGLFGTM